MVAIVGIHRGDCTQRVGNASCVPHDSRRCPLFHERAFFIDDECPRLAICVNWVIEVAALNQLSKDKLLEHCVVYQKTVLCACKLFQSGLEVVVTELWLVQHLKDVF